jgi:3-isopropylmalate/(R)-2-methylmalate dehydratase small subunit
VECNLRVNETDKINIDLVKGTITNLNDNNMFNFKPLPNFLLELLKSDGLVGYTKRSLNRVDI